MISPSKFFPAYCPCGSPMMGYKRRRPDKAVPDGPVPIEHMRTCCKGHIHERRFEIPEPDFKGPMQNLVAEMMGDGGIDVRPVSDTVGTGSTRSATTRRERRRPGR